MVPATPILDAFDRVGCLFGYPIKHSFSPIVFQTTFDHLNLKWTYFLLESMDTEEFLRLMRNPKFYGAAVTMPHKINIIPHLDDLTPECRAVGACNTVFLRETPGSPPKCVGTNTDVIGIREAFYQNVRNPEEVFQGRPGMVIGGGGAARSAVYALQTFLKASPIYIVNRDKAEVDAVIAHCRARGFDQGLLHVDSVDQAEALEGPGAIVACVPDFPPKTEDEKRARAVIECMLGKAHKGAMLEMCYHPRPWTELGYLAEKASWQVILGTEAVIYQGAEQAKLWTGRELEELPLAQIKENFAKALNQARM